MMSIIQYTHHSMIIILTNGTPASRNIVITKLRTYIEFDIVDTPHFSSQQHILRTTATSTSIKLVTPCMLKSQRYEIFCIAKQLNLKFCIIVDRVHNDDFEELSGKYDKPAIDDENLEDILKIKYVEKANKAYKFVCAPTCDYLSRVRSIMKKVGNEIDGYWFRDEMEKRVYGLIDKNFVELNVFEEWYRKMIDSEFKARNTGNM